MCWAAAPSEGSDREATANGVAVGDIGRLVASKFKIFRLNSSWEVVYRSTGSCGGAGGGCSGCGSCGRVERESKTSKRKYQVGGDREATTNGVAVGDVGS